ncbi:MAG: glycosyltransferase family 4 protein [Thermodesulfobacteriota bacterium]|nr:glycosyltransferase family 4 protein [Thermodesulfobacteriota bacterium]
METLYGKRGTHLQEKTEGAADDPLKICILTYRGNPTCGGQGVYVKRVSTALRELGHSVDVISGPPYPHLDDGVTLRKLASLDLYNPEDLFRVPSVRELKSPINLIEWLGVSSGGFPEPLTFSLRAYNFFRNNGHAYDIIHDNQCLGYGLLGIKALGLPLVATIHHPITVDRDVEVEAERKSWKKLKVYRWYSFLGMQVRTSRKISHIITVSEASKKDIGRAFKIHSGKFRVIENGIDTETFHPEPGVKRLENRLMVTNSADTPLKGLRHLLEAVASIRKKRDINLTVIGQPKKGGVIETLVRDLDLGNCVTFTSRIEDSEFARYYAEATIAVVPSIYEGFGLPAGEAMACGVPVISTTGGALAEVVGDAGILVPPGDSKALKKSILHLLDSPEERERLGKAGYERVLNNFTWRNTALKVIDVYREAIDAHC